LTQPVAGVGEKFGKYVIVNRLGMGGMAEVFLCRLPGIGGFDKTVVVKRILPDLIEDPNFVEMFLDEARVAANLNHPNIVQVFEIDHIDQVPYMAMEYIKGPSLSQLLKAARKAKALHLGHFAKIMSASAAGLHYAHNARDPQGNPLQLVHRDVSPQNILVSLEGVTKIVDFGVARARGRLATTQAGTIKGKLRYMSPEQILGREFDHKADIFALGVCLYLGATGRYPFDGDNDVETMKAAVTGDFALPSTVVQGFPPALEAIIVGTLQADPTKRTQTADEVHNALEEFVREGEYQSSIKAVAAWVNELFPDFEARAATSLAHGTAITSVPSLTGTPVSGQFLYGMAPSQRQPSTPGKTDGSGAISGVPAPTGPWKSVALVSAGVAGALGLAGVLFAVSHSSPPPVTAAPAAPVVQAAAPPPTPAPTPTPAAVTPPPVVAASSAAPSVDVAAAAAAKPPAGKAPAWQGTWKPPAATKPTAAAAAPPTPAAPQNRSCTTSWTPDSPLPPCP